MIYAPKHAAAAAMVKQKGAAVTFTRITQAYDPVAGTTTPSESTVAGHAVGTRGDPIRYQALGLVESNAPTLLFVPATYGELPSPGDTVVWGGVIHTVRDVTPAAPDGTAILARVVAER